MRKHLLSSLKYIILALVLYWIVASINPEDIKALREQNLHWGLIFASFSVILIANLLSFVRWYFFVRALQVPFTLIEAIRLGFLGNMFNAVFFGAVGGDLFRAIAAAKQAGTKRPEVIASVLVDRALGLLGLVLVAALSLQFYSGALSANMDWIRRGAWIASLAGIVGLLLITFAGHHLPIQLLNRIPGIGHTLHRMAKAGMLFEGRPMLVLLLIGMSLLIHSLLTVGVYYTSIAIYAQAPSLAEHFMTVPPAFAVAALPLSPGGIGVQEMAMEKLFEELPSLPAGFKGLIVAAMFRIETVFITLIGGIYYAIGASEINRLKKETQKWE